MAIKKIWFVCTGNTCRSPMAAALALQALRESYPERSDIIIASAGVMAETGAPASEQAITVMEERGLDLKEHCSKGMVRKDIAQAALVLTMTHAQRDWLINLFPQGVDKIFLLSEYAGMEGEVSDPFGDGVNTYRKAAYELDRLVRKALDRFIK